MSTGFTQSAEAWDARFSRPGFLFGTAPNVWLTRQRELFRPGQRALAVADGEGRNSVWLASLGLRVDAFDISTVAVEKARQFARTSGVDVAYRVCDCDGWPWAESIYDHVVAIFVQFAHPEMRTRLFGNMIRALNPGGHLLLQGYTPKQIDYGTGGPGVLSHLYTEELLREAFRELDIVALDSYEDVLDEGTQHSGRSALIGLVARKAR